MIYKIVFYFFKRYLTKNLTNFICKFFRFEVFLNGIGFNVNFHKRLDNINVNNLCLNLNSLNSVSEIDKKLNLI